MIDRIFGSIRVVSEAAGSTPKDKLFDTVCELCGRQAVMFGGNIRRAVRGGSSGCKCSTRSRTHGLYAHRLFKTWHGMMRRCHCETHEAFEHYGGRGIVVCDEWRVSPAAFIDWCEASGWSEGMQIDRINNDLGYFPDNCRIVTPIENGNNKRNNRILDFGVRKITVAQAAREFGLKKTTIKERLNRGWSVIDAVRPLPGQGTHDGI